jgi:hypothetical protein
MLKEIEQRLPIGSADIPFLETFWAPFCDSAQERKQSNLPTQTDSIARQRNETRSKTTINPCSKAYWTTERLTWLEETVKETQYLYSDHIDGGNHVHTYRPSTGELIRRLKGFPEWPGLSARQAHAALVIGLGKLADAGEDPWSMLPDNQVKILSSEDDFLAAWPKVRGFGVNLAKVVEQAKAKPITWRPELEEQLGPVSPTYKLFCDVCMYLQSEVGPDGYILLPQHELAGLLETKQGGISSFCQRAKDAGFLREVNGGQWSRTQRLAKRYKCLSVLVKG